MDANIPLWNLDEDLTIVGQRMETERKACLAIINETDETGWRYERWLKDYANEFLKPEREHSPMVLNAAIELKQTLTENPALQSSLLFQLAAIWLAKEGKLLSLTTEALDMSGFIPAVPFTDVSGLYHFAASLERKEREWLRLKLEAVLVGNQVIKAFQLVSENQRSRQLVLTKFVKNQPNLKDTVVYGAGKGALSLGKEKTYATLLEIFAGMAGVAAEVAMPWLKVIAVLEAIYDQHEEHTKRFNRNASDDLDEVTRSLKQENEGTKDLIQKLRMIFSAITTPQAA
jgi:hypothetical protein